MKNTIILIIAILAIVYFVKEGEKNTDAGSESRGVAENLKIGIGSTLKKLISISENTVHDVSSIWEPKHVNDKRPDHMMDNLNDPKLSSFSHVLLPKRGSFIKSDIRQAIINSQYN